MTVVCTLQNIQLVLYVPLPRVFKSPPEKSFSFEQTKYHHLECINLRCDDALCVLTMSSKVKKHEAQAPHLFISLLLMHLKSSNPVTFTERIVTQPFRRQ